VTHLSPDSVARALGGKVVGRNKVRAPSPGAGSDDLSLEVRIANDLPDGFAVCDYYGENWKDAKDYVRGKLGIRWEPLRNDTPVEKIQALAKKQQLGKIVATYDYTGKDGTHLYQVVRYHPKDFRQRRSDGKGGWIWENEGDVLYRWPDLIKYPDATVFVCEGEKDADRLASLGYCATTVCGSSKWSPECVDPLKGRHVFILEDNDEKGRKRALNAARALHGVSASLRVVPLPDLPERADVSDWLDEDPSRAETLVDICLSIPEWQPPARGAPQTAAPTKAPPQPIELFWHGKEYGRKPRCWLIKDLVPETGTGLASGQWGVAKTFCMLDLAAAVMTTTPYAGREIVRRGGILFVAAEGAIEIPIRLQGLVEHKLRPASLANGALGEPITADLEALPFAWIEEAPDLKDQNSFNRLLEAAKSAARNLREQFDLPLVLIVIDTLSASANLKDANDAAEGQFIMNRLNELSRATGAFALAVDHFGKAVETGTRGTSAKEGAADVVLALLGDREINGTIRNTRMALRKLRGGKTGTETPFDLKVVDLEDGETTCIIEWRTERAVAASETSKKDRWSKSLRIFQAALTDALAEHGATTKPFADGPALRTVSVQAVRDEFMKAYVGDADAKRKAFTRSVQSARVNGLIGSREIAGVDHVWLVDPDTTNRTSRPDRQDTH
jgi:AAA domain